MFGYRTSARSESKHRQKQMQQCQALSISDFAQILAKHAAKGDQSMFNTLRYARILENAGIERPQAEAHVQMLAEIIEVDVATKQDLRELEHRLIFKICAIIGSMITLALAIIKLF